MKEGLAHLTTKRLYFMSTPDVVDAPVRVRPPSPVCTPDVMSKAIDTFVQHNPAHHITQILHRLGLTKAGPRASKEVRKEKLRTGAKTLMRYILREYNEIDQADSIAKIFFSGLGFQSETVKEVGMKIATPITTSTFAATCLLRSIDTHAGSLNDSAVDQYAKIQEEHKSCLFRRHRITECRKVANALNDEQVKIKHHKDSRFGLFVSADNERMFRLMLRDHGLTNKAVEEGVELAIIGDGAAITTSTKNAGLSRGV